ncbi:uncharacterized protein LOC135205498 [Macrobrachium nipponense]|uniref:uncharacterized protein LOC135205498 n=1 Tax=Macrobrachium nipponense TaxID=159736 RepID=UPI0030C7BA1B
MVQLVCSCLNIRLHVRETPEALAPGVPNLKPEESQHPFFSKGACVATLNLGGITEGQKFLVRSYFVSEWTIHECLNCHLLTHAIHSTNGTVAVSSLLINDANKIQMLQRCEGYSPVFNMVLPTSLDNRPLPPLSPTDFNDKRLPQVEEALGAIQQQVAKFLKKAESQVEANIRSYTEQQQAALSALQIRVRRERQTIMRILSNLQTSFELQSEEDPLDMEMEGAKGLMGQKDYHDFSEVDKFDEDLDEAESDTLTQDEPDTALPPLVNIQSRASQPLSLNPSQGITAGMRNMRLSSSVAVPRVKPQGNVRVAQSLDVEGLFDMDGMVEASVMPSQGAYHSDEEDTDDSNHDEGIHIPGGQDRVRDIAQSVPVSVPMWPGSRPKQLPEPLNIEMPSDNDQMAASIQALARSVHSTSVDLFGDLPRPGRPRQPL